MKKTKFLVLVLITLLLIIFPLTINGAGAQINPDDYSSEGPSATDVQDMFKFGGKIAGIIQVVGTIVAVGALIVIGIRYVVASADEKAEYKERMLPYIIGAVLLFGASNIVNIVYKMSQENNNIVMYRQTCYECGTQRIGEDKLKKCPNCGAIYNKEITQTIEKQ